MCARASAESAPATRARPRRPRGGTARLLLCRSGSRAGGPGCPHSCEGPAAHGRLMPCRACLRRHTLQARGHPCAERAGRRRSRSLRGARRAPVSAAPFQHGGAGLMSHSIRRCRAPAWLSVSNSELAPLGGACLGRVAALSTVPQQSLVRLNDSITRS